MAQWLNAEQKKKIERKLTKMDETPKTCENCVYGKNEGIVIKCHRNPPVAGVGFVVVYNDDWCGEFKMKIPVE